MTSSIKRIILLAGIAIATTSVYAQEMRVLSLKQLVGDIKARTNAMYDANGEKMALVKVAIPALDNVSFQGTYIAKAELRDNEYWVYVAKGAKKMRVSHKNFLPLEINFRDYLNEDITSGTTYQMNLSLNSKADMTLAIIKTNLKSASMTIDGETYETVDGEFAVSLPKGTHSYTLSTTIPGFPGRSGQFDITGDKAVEVIPQINFETSKKYTLTLTAEEGVHFKVDGVLQDKTGKLSANLAAGIHIVESYVGDGNSYFKKEEVDMTSSDVTKDMSLGGTLIISQPKKAEFEISPLSDALTPSKTKFKCGEVVSALGNYTLKATQKGYDSKTITISVEPGNNVKEIVLVSEADKYYNGWDGYTRNVDKAIKEYKKIADKGDEIAQYKLGQCYAHDKNDSITALVYWKKAAAQGHLDAMTEVAISKPDEKSKISYLTAPAEAGKKLAMYHLGLIYGFGSNKVKNIDKGIYWMQKAYDNDVDLSSVTLSLLYMQKGQLDSAYGILKNACKEKGAPEALCALAVQMSKIDNPEMADKAYQAYKLAIDNGCADASLKILDFGENLYQGNLLNKNLNLAEKCFLANPSAALSVERLADYDFYGLCQHKCDKEKAVKAYCGISGARPDLKLRIAEYYYWDKKDIDAAAEWYEPIAQENLDFRGDIKIDLYKIGQYLDHRGMKSKAVFFYESAHNRGLTNNKDLLLKLGTAYYKGDYVEKSYEKAVQYFIQGVGLGSGTCARMLANCQANGYGVDMDKQKAKQTYEQAIQLNDVRSYSFLGTLYYKEGDKEAALECWRKGGENGDEVSIKNLIKVLGASKDSKLRDESKQWQSKLQNKK